MKKKMKTKGLVLLSGGLDSTLAAKVLIEQGVCLEAINFVTCFCTCTRKGCRHEATKVSEELSIKLKVSNVTREYLAIVRNPKHGYGSNLNPCIDCRIFIFTKAKNYMDEIGASFIVTGEVLGERPMSQRLDAMRLIERESGLKGLIVRPLSAKLLEPTKAEREGFIDRERLLGIQGRSRKPQIALAKEFDVTDYPCPAGGCLLTDPGFARRARDLIAHGAFTLENVQLLKIGRHFRLGPGAKFIVGRNRGENERLLAAAQRGDILFDTKSVPGPIGMLRGDGGLEGLLDESCAVMSRYSDSNPHKAVIAYWRHPDTVKTEITAFPAKKEALAALRI